MDISILFCCCEYTEETFRLTKNNHNNSVFIIIDFRGNFLGKKLPFLRFFFILLLITLKIIIDSICMELIIDDKSGIYASIFCFLFSFFNHYRTPVHFKFHASRFLYFPQDISNIIIPLDL